MCENLIFYITLNWISLDSAQQKEIRRCHLDGYFSNIFFNFYSLNNEFKTMNEK